MTMAKTSWLDRQSRAVKVAVAIAVVAAVVGAWAFVSAIPRWLDDRAESDAAARAIAEDRAAFDREADRWMADLDRWGFCRSCRVVPAGPGGLCDSCARARVRLERAYKATDPNPR